MPDTLQEGAPAGLPSKNAAVLGFLQIQLEEDVQRRRGNGEHDTEDTETPAPSVQRIEVLGGLRACESSDDVGGRRERVGEGSVLELGGVGGDDIDTVGHAAESDCIEDLSYLMRMTHGLTIKETYISSAESRQVVASGHDDHAQRREDGHEQETLGTTPDIEDLGQRDEDCCRKAVADDVDGRQERVRFKVGSHVGKQVTDDGGLEGVDEVEAPDTTHKALISITFTLLVFLKEERKKGGEYT